MAQSFELPDLPPGTLPVPGFQAGQNQFLPALSINGFDCQAAGFTCNHGLGLKQAIERAASPDIYPETAALFTAAVHFARRPLLSPDNRAAIKQNNLIAEFRGFLALATLVLEENGYQPNQFPAVDLPSHLDAIGLFQEVLQNLEAITFNADFSDDAVKWTGPLGSFARTIDFYLALEQAYLYYNQAGATLFSCQEKNALLDLLQAQISLLDTLGNKSVMDLNFIKILGFDIASIIRDISYDEVQAGNWPMKVHAAVGYAAIIQQQPDDGSCSQFTPLDEYDRWLGRALRSIAGPDPENRSHHWAYQTAGGQRFWAEGPFYFNYGLTTAIPFLHAARLHNLLNANDDFTVDDPFHAPWFLNPVGGYADLVTPEGAAPPLEDGNKIPQEAAFLLRWIAPYGDSDTGEQFAWIAGAQSALPSADLWMHALALPITSRKTAPAATLSPQHSSIHTPQIVLRRDGQTGSCKLLPEERTSPCHYVLLNGESTASIRPGEGHEQSDQLQLLYYVDDTSFLVDGGYDSAPGIQNSTWSDYRFHNVMTADRVGMQGGHGGLPGPVAGLSCTRQTSTPIGEVVLPAACMFADHNPVERWQHRQYGRIDQIDAAISIYPDAPLDNDELFYERTLFFIDDKTAPYLIDINTGRVKADTLRDQVLIKMQYYGNAAMSETQQASALTLWESLWAAPDSLGSTPSAGPHSLHIQTFSVEADHTLNLTPEILREVPLSGTSAGEGLPVNRLSLANGSNDIVDTSSHTTVAFIQPHPGNSPPPARLLVQQMLDDHILPRPWQAFTWAINSTTMDVLLVRAPGNDQPVTAAINLPSENTWVIMEEYQTPGMTFDPQTGTVALDADVRAGYLRLNQPGNVGTEEHDAEVLRLEQNSPNPFKTATQIRFELPHAQDIRLDVFDILGRHVVSLYEGVKQAGRHTITWKPENVADGMYFFRLQTSSAVYTRQTTLVSH